MIVNRKRPNLHTICWTPKGATNFTGSEITFHAGANFVYDEVYYNGLENNPDFKEQIKTGHMTIEMPAKRETEKGGKVPKSLQEAIAQLDENKALQIVSCTLDGVDLREIARFDKRRVVALAAEKQCENRQGFMNSLQPQSAPVSEAAPIPMGEF